MLASSTVKQIRKGALCILRVQVRFVDGVRNTALAALPPRWWQDVIEVPILLTAAFSFAKLLLIRCVQAEPCWNEGWNPSIRLSC